MFNRINLNNSGIVFSILFFLLLITTSTFSQISVIKKPVNFGMKPTDSRTINTVIIHSTFNNSGGAKYDIDLIIKQFSFYSVSSHYLIGRDGAIYQLVDEKNIAFHAGKSILPNGMSGINNYSLGIEIVTSFDEAPVSVQMKSLVDLVKDIKSRYKIEYILRHSDIAPGRKTDPWNFDWDGFLQNLSETKSQLPE
jgi:N-acetyl-anhydromuramyl-L-alanine amidase AmpD